jgi:hypothetical protein
MTGAELQNIQSPQTMKYESNARENIVPANEAYEKNSHHDLFSSRLLKGNVFIHDSH